MKQGCSSLKTTVPDAFYKLSRISFKTIAGLLQFSVGLGHEFRFVNDESLVVAFADESCRVIAFHMEDQTSAVDVHQLCLAVFSINAIIAGVAKTANEPLPRASAVLFSLTVISSCPLIPFSNMFLKLMRKLS